MTSALAVSWRDAITDKPLDAAIALAALICGTIVAAFVLRRLMRHTRSLRHQVLAVTLVALAIGAIAAVLLARLMILDSAELGRVAGVLGVTAVFATLLVVIASAPLGRDVRSLEATVRRIEGGDRAVRTDIVRADELGHVARALDELTARLDTLERERAGYEAERTAMLSSVGHDLRTPLAALRVAVEALADGVALDPDRYLRSMRRDVEALSALVDDFFLLARIESGRFDLYPVAVDLTEIADEAVEALAPVAAASGVTLALAATARVRVQGNPTALGRVIRNLIDNAVRHAPSGSEVRVEVSADGKPSVTVVDEGPGFPAGFSAEAFERFTRADASRTRTTGGAGLGLAIARGLIEAHGGRIWIEGPPGGRVAFELPRNGQ
ncbi:MAG TPA: HAMP domain-containing sensor histidine kinase [Ilumatobacteraceae bacterium]|nr:HAMP domain-containing sensor histidine kinase [Ilumatobacteraceae bacterium]